MIVLAVIAILAASLLYLHPNPTSKPRIASPTPVSRQGDLVSYDFVTPSTGWALVVTVTSGQFSVFRTIDGANHWQKQLTGGQGSLLQLGPQSVQFFDRSDGFIEVAASPSFLVDRTTDSGAHWHPVVLPGPGSGVITFSDPSNGWLLVLTGSPTDQTVNLYGTRDGGGTWQRLPDPPPDVCLRGAVSCLQVAPTVAFRRPSEGWIGTRGDPLPHVYSTSNGGRSWNRHELPIPADGLAAGAIASVDLLPGTGVVAFLDEGNGPSFPAASFDGGASWSFGTPHPSGGSGFGGFISFQDTFHWWVIDGHTLYGSSDAGQTWSQVSNQVLVGLYFCQFLDSKHAWGLARLALGPGGDALALTADGGLRWTRAAVPDPA